MKFIKQSSIITGLLLSSLNTAWAYDDVAECNNYNVMVFNATGSNIYASLYNLGTMSHGDYSTLITSEFPLPNDSGRIIGQITNSHAYSSNFWNLWGDLTVWGELQLENYNHYSIFDEEIGKAHYSLSNTSSGGYFATPITMHPLAMGYQIREFATNHCLDTNPGTRNQAGEYFLLITSAAVG